MRTEKDNRRRLNKLEFNSTLLYICHCRLITLFTYVIALAQYFWSLLLCHGFLYSLYFVSVGCVTRHHTLENSVTWIALLPREISARYEI